MLGSATTGRTQGRSHIRAQLKPGATQPMEIAATTELRGFRPTNPGLVRRCFGKSPSPRRPPRQVSAGFSTAEPLFNYGVPKRRAPVAGGPCLLAPRPTSLV